MPRKKKPEPKHWAEMTTQEMAERLFPPEVAERLQAIAHENDAKENDHKRSRGKSTPKDDPASNI
jgi:hypothetical protein